jgi:formate dehydrogenase maturation protein FdhE
MVLEWLALLRSGPLANLYEVHLKRTGCPFCNAKPTLIESVVHFETSGEGGAKMKCTVCNCAWLRPDER